MNLNDRLEYMWLTRTIIFYSEKFTHVDLQGYHISGTQLCIILYSIRTLIFGDIVSTLVNALAALTTVIGAVRRRWFDHALFSICFQAVYTIQSDETITSRYSE